MRSNLSFINVYKNTNTKSELVTQLLYGDTFKKLNKKKSWIKIKNNADNYKGYIKNKKFPKDLKNTHKVCVLSSNIYSKPNTKYKIKKKLSFGSRVKVLNKSGIFFKFDNYWIKKKNLKEISHRINNSFRDVKKFINVKYKWGFKHFSAVDCSGLIQLLLNFNNKFCPRDTKDQVKYFKKKIKFKNIKKNDLIFWKGHVAIVLSKKKLIHAYGPLKKVVIMNIDYAIKRIEKTAKLKIVGIRRLS